MYSSVSHWRHWYANPGRGMLSVDWQLLCACANSKQHTSLLRLNHFYQEGIYYKWASVKMTLKFHFLWSTLFWLEESVSAVYSDWLRGKSETKSCSWSAADVWRRHLELLHIICTPGSDLTFAMDFLQNSTPFWCKNHSCSSKTVEVTNIYQWGDVKQRAESSSRARWSQDKHNHHTLFRIA